MACKKENAEIGLDKFSLKCRLRQRFVVLFGTVSDVGAAMPNELI